MYNIIIPTYNEKENIKPLFFMINEVFKKIEKDYKIIIVDDNSPDGTYKEILKYKKHIPLDIIQRKSKLGLGSAYKSALEKCDGDHIIIMDADLSHNPYDIEELINCMDYDSYDIVTGSRYIENKKSGIHGWNFTRKLTSRGANNLAQLILGIKCSDCTGSYRLYRKDVFKALLENVKSSRFAYQMEIMYLAEKNGFRIAEVPIVFCERAYGVSKMGISEIFYFLYIIFFLLFRIR